MTTSEFNKAFNKIVGDDMSINFAIGCEGTTSYVAIFYGEIPESEIILDELDTIFIRTGKAKDMAKFRSEGIKFLKKYY